MCDLKLQSISVHKLYLSHIQCTNQSIIIKHREILLPRCFQCQQSRIFVCVLKVMAAVQGSNNSFVCEWVGCAKSYEAVKNLRKHQRLYAETL